MKDEHLPAKRKRRRYSWFINETKFLDGETVERLKKSVERAKDEAIRQNKHSPVRDWLMVELGLFTGLRVQEMVDLQTSDLYLRKKPAFLLVRKGKGNKTRTVYLPKIFSAKCLSYLDWKARNSTPSDYLFSNRTGKQLTKRALQKSFKRCLVKAGVEGHYSIHCLRHTYGSFLYKSSNHNLRLVQEQLGHSSIRTTQVYAGLMNEEVKEALEKLYERQ